MSFRNSEQSKKALSICENKCVICGWDKTERKGNSLVEGAHVKPYANDSSSDMYSNIIALCPNHHTQFDRYLFYIDSDTRKTVFFDVNDRYHDINLSSKISYIEKRYLAYRQYLYREQDGRSL